MQMTVTALSTVGRRCRAAQRCALSWFWTGPWRWLRWLLVILVLTYPVLTLNLLVVLVLVGICLLCVAWPLKGMRTNVSLPSLREAVTPSSPPEGVTRYREWP